MKKFCDVILVTLFGEHNGDDVITDFLKFDFVTISLKNHNLVKSHNFRSPLLKIKGLLKICN